MKIQKKSFVISNFNKHKKSFLQNIWTFLNNEFTLKMKIEYRMNFFRDEIIKKMNRKK